MNVPHIEHLPFCAITLAAGKGTRMKSDMPKVLHKLAGQSMLSHVLLTALALHPEKLCCVIGPGMDDVEAEARRCREDITCAIQHNQSGTADAVLAAKDAVGAYDGPVMVLYGDTPLITEDIIKEIYEALQLKDVVVVGIELDDPTGYGRLVMEGDQLVRIVEQKDASDEELKITLGNSGVIAAQGTHLWELLSKVDNNNASGEYYLTDIVGLANEEGLTCGVIKADPQAMMGVNSRVQLSDMERIYQQGLREKAMIEGVTMVSPETVFLSRDTVLGRDVIIHPHVVIGPGVTIEDGVEIKSFSHMESCHVRKDTTMGPYARLRPGADVGPKAHLGNFVEIKKSRIGEGSKVSHLSYIGDAEIGKGVNVGAGTITCNYDGYDKFTTVMKDGVFIGSNSALVAPVTIGEGAIVGAGSTVTEDVPDDATALARGRQVNLDGHAAEFRAKKGVKKAA